jgi:hypothetical protein
MVRTQSRRKDSRSDNASKKGTKSVFYKIGFRKGRKSISNGRPFTKKVGLK